MSLTDTTRFDWFEAKAPILFLVGAALYAVFVASEILATYNGTPIPQDTTFASAATVLIPLGLLGLYPALVERRPYLSRVAAVLAVIGAISWSIVFVGGGILEPTGILTEAPGPLALSPFVGMATTHLAFALFGITVLLVDIYPKAIGVFLLVAAVGPFLLGLLTGLPSFVGNLVNLVMFLGIGVVLLTAGVPTAEVEPPAEPAT